MSRALDNDNPTIFAPTQATSSRRVRSGKSLLWDEDAAGYQELAGSLDRDPEGNEEKEEIDAEEVFGELGPILSTPGPQRLVTQASVGRVIDVKFRSATLDYGSRTSSLTRTATCRQPRGHPRFKQQSLGLPHPYDPPLFHVYTHRYVPKPPSPNPMI